MSETRLSVAPESNPNRMPNVVYWFGSLVFLISLYGFGSKFVEFVQTFRESPEGVFAISPVMNYLLASIGFFLLLVWAGFQGMFRNIEQPKLTMLAIEEELNALEPPDQLIRSAVCAVPPRRSVRQSPVNAEFSGSTSASHSLER